MDNNNPIFKISKYARNARNRHQNILTKKRKGQWLRRNLTKKNINNINNTRKIALAGERAMLSNNNLRRYSQKLKNDYNKRKNRPAISEFEINYMGRYPGTTRNGIMKEIKEREEKKKKNLKNFENEIGEVEEELRQRNAEEK